MPLGDVWRNSWANSWNGSWGQAQASVSRGAGSGKYGGKAAKGSGQKKKRFEDERELLIYLEALAQAFKKKPILEEVEREEIQEKVIEVKQSLAEDKIDLKVADYGLDILRSLSQQKSADYQLQLLETYLYMQMEMAAQEAEDEEIIILSLH